MLGGKQPSAKRRAVPCRTLTATQDARPEPAATFVEPGVGAGRGDRQRQAGDKAWPENSRRGQAAGVKRALIDRTDPYAND